MSRPDSVVICGQPLRIDVDERYAGRLHEHNEDFWAVGTTSITEGRIVIRGGQPFHAERDTVLHEILHAVLKLTGQTDRFRPYEPDEKYPEEPVVYALATALLAVLRSNPGLVSYLTEEPTPSSKSGGSGGEAR